MNPDDPQAVNLAKSIRQAETGDSEDPYNQKGASGEFGAYQFMPETYKNYAQKYLGDANAQPSVENQNKIAYSFVKEKKDAGYNPAQIASMWNAGEGKPDAYKENYRGTNAEGVSYDTPAYSAKVSQYYKQLSAGQTPIAAAVPASTNNNAEQNPSLLSSLGNDTANALGGAGQALTDASSGKINPLSGILQGAGSIAGGITSGVNDLATHIPVVGGLIRGAENIAQEGVQKAAGTAPGQKVVGAIQGFADKHPELAGDISAGANIAGLIPVLKGASIAKDLVGGAVDSALTGAKDATYDMVSPKLTPSRARDAIGKFGTETKGLLKETNVAKDPYFEGISRDVEKNVPGFNSSKGLTYNFEKVDSSIDEIGDKLKADVIKEGKNRIYSPNELKGIIDKIEPPISVRGTAFEKQIDLLKDAVMQIAEKHGYHVSDLLDVRKDFDQLISAEYPNLYEAEYSPMRKAVSGMREALNQYTSDRLPAELDFRNRLLTQSKLIRARENMAERMAAGNEKVIGKNAIDRFGEKHPVMRGLLRGAGRAAMTGLGVRGAEELIP